MTKNKLKDGALGAKMVEFFEREHGIIAVDADALPGSDFGGEHVNYRITFEDESVSDWKVIFAPGLTTDIIDAECFNQVI